MTEMNWFEKWMINRRTLGRADRVLKAVGAHLAVGAGDRTLEIGSGGGGLVARLYERYHPARVVGTDFDPMEVEAARRFLAARWGELPATVELEEADALELPFPDGSFDVVFAMMMLHHVETNFREYVRRPEALREVLRVLRPGGRFVYSEIFRRTEIRRTLAELGFREEFLRSGWRHDLAIVRSPAPP